MKISTFFSKVFGNKDPKVFYRNSKPGFYESIEKRIKKELVLTPTHGFQSIKNKCESCGNFLYEGYAPEAPGSSEHWISWCPNCNTEASAIFKFL